jgi:alkylhydroperoxidase family enzyme
MAGHTALARQIGYTEEEIADLDRVAQSEAFDPALRAALLYAEAMTRDAHRVDGKLFAEMKRHYQDSEIMEITSVVGLTNYWNRFTTALRIDLSGTDEPYDAPGTS